MGLLIYCNPNAGLYESSTQAPFSPDWVDFYTALGCDVLLWNYRGYGRSTGTALRTDGGQAGVSGTGTTTRMHAGRPNHPMTEYGRKLSQTPWHPCVLSSA
jgi:pimeloyl-ACP methyl ester carboxylesterase